MRTVNIQLAAAELSRLVESVAAGEHIVIAKSGKPLALLTPFAPTAAPRPSPRPAAPPGAAAPSRDWQR